ncbi:unnamed protein product [Lactuca saligna]|uniref:Uncharacterized protein n=1 Tax=Lactuca saligna TaxID=75948 RepID=A0AA35Z578_LACSI|nr:unnamed protein product [Lactuca saligna]
MLLTQPRLFCPPIHRLHHQLLNSQCLLHRSPFLLGYYTFSGRWTPLLSMYSSFKVTDGDETEVEEATGFSIFSSQSNDSSSTVNMSIRSFFACLKEVLLSLSQFVGWLGHKVEVYFCFAAKESLGIGN